MIRTAWHEELAVLGLSLLLMGGVAHLLDWPMLLFWGGPTLFLCWHFFQLLRLSLWLGQPKSIYRPYGIGLWRNLLLELDNLKEMGRKRKRKLGRMLSGFLESTGALPDATLVINDAGRLDWWNSVAADYLGLKRKVDKGALIETRVKDPIFLAYLAKGDFRQPLKMPAPLDGNISLEVRIVPYGKGKLLLQARDISRLQQLEMVQRDFVANVSHEMRTPLTVVYGYLEMLQDAPGSELESWKTTFSTMQQQTTRMQRIVEDLLLLSRLETHDYQPSEARVDIPYLLQTLLKESRQLSEGLEHSFEFDVDDALCMRGNGKELESAFSNLLFNAVRYTPKGGRITVRWCSSPTGPCFSVSDTGIGIAAEHIPRLTERFYRVDVGRSRDCGGTGLGLAIVKHVLGRHEGHLEIKSQVGEGSCFICHFAASRVIP